MAATSRARFPTAAEAAGALEVLAGLGWLRPRPAPPTGGRPVAGPVYELHPDLLAAQAAQATQGGELPSSVASVACAARERTEADDSQHRGPSPATTPTGPEEGRP